MGYYIIFQTRVSFYKVFRFFIIQFNRFKMNVG